MSQDFANPEPFAGSGVAGISRILPATYGLDGIRRVLIVGQGFSQVREALVTLLVFLAVLLPFSLRVFGRAVRRAKREGSLIQYQEERCEPQIHTDIHG